MKLYIGLYSLGIIVVLSCCYLCEVETVSVEKERARAAEKWSGSANNHPSVDSSDQYEYIYVDENGNYYEPDEDEEDEEEEEEDDGEEVFPEIPSPRRRRLGYTVTPPVKEPADPRPFLHIRTLNEVERAAECTPRNNSYIQQLQENHKRSLQEEKQRLMERRKEKREKREKEEAEIAEETEDKRATMSKLTTQELHDMEAQAARFEKAKQQKEEEERELAEAASGKLNVGDKVMARFQRKVKYLFGRITAVRNDGTYDIKYDNGNSEMRVDKTLIVKPESEKEVARGSKIGKNAELKQQTLALREQQREGLVQLQQQHEQLIAENLAAQAEREKDPGIPMGADCESQACGACKLVVEEFAERIHLNIKNEDVTNIRQLLDYMTPFCESPQIRKKYSEVVEIICKKMLVMRDHREYFIRQFESDDDWENVLIGKSLLQKKQKICKMSGFCDEDDFHYKKEDDDGWGSDECFICHWLMKDLEEKASLYRRVDDAGSVNIVRKACNNLDFPKYLSEKCAELTTINPSLMDIAWIVKVHYESIKKKKRTYRTFPDVTCEGLSKCRRYAATNDDRREQVKNEIQAVFA